MQILLCGAFDVGERELWQAALAAAWPAGQWLTLEQARAAPASVRAAVVANPLPGSLQGRVEGLPSGCGLLASTQVKAVGVPPVTFDRMKPRPLSQSIS